MVLFRKELIPAKDVFRFCHKVLKPYEFHMESLSKGETPKEVLVKEGRAEVHQDECVFFNPVQTFNRDLSVLVVDTFLKHQLWSKAKRTRKDRIASRPFRIVDALSATGLRSIRYAKELENLPLVDQIIANDLSSKATRVIEKNIVHNCVTEKVRVNTEDASCLFYRNRNYEDRFMVIDLDPFGSPAPFLDGAVQAIGDGGLLMVTCTDMAILCGNTPETCFAKYGAMSLRIAGCHEMALRIILKSIEGAANRYGRYIVPLLSVSVDFYIRMFVQVCTGAYEAKFAASKSAIVYHCTGCHSHELQNMGRILPKSTSNANDQWKFSFAAGPSVDRRCKHCNQTQHIGGPIWSANIHDVDFIDLLKSRLMEREKENIFETFKRLNGILHVIGEELQDVPLYQTVSNLARTLRVPTPPSNVFRSAILNAGYKVSYSHAAHESVKTDAPNSVLWDIMREWARKQGVSVETVKINQVAKAILGKETETRVSFQLHPQAEPLSKELELLRYQPNPLPYWGPKALPGAKDKRKLNQGKRKMTDKQDGDSKKQKELVDSAATEAD